MDSGLPGHLYAPAQGRSYAFAADSPGVLWFDPGETVGWSYIECDKNGLADPEVHPHEAIRLHQHGQIVADPVEKVANERASEVQREHMRLSRRLGSGFTQDYTTEHWAATQMLELVFRYEGCAVGIETFVVRRYDQSREFLSPVRITAAFELLLWQHGILLFRQSPADAKTTATDERLKKWGLYDKTGGMVHARDADRHAITFLRSCKDLQRGKARREFAWPHIYGGPGM